MTLTAAIYAPHVWRDPLVYEDLNDLNTTYLPWQGWRAEAHDVVVKPARTLTGAVQRLIGLDPVRQHAASLAAHLLAGLLLFLLAVRLLPIWPAVFAAGVFWLAPIQTEAVAYAAARSDMLVTLAVLVGLLAVWHDVFWLAFTAAVAAVLAKESGVVAWAILPAFALWIGAPWSISAWCVWAVTTSVGTYVALSTHVGTFELANVMASLRDLAGLVLTPPWALTIDPLFTSWTPLLVCAVLTFAGWWRSPRWTLLVVGGVLLAWSPRLLVALSEGPKYHHLYCPMLFLSMGAGVFLTKGFDDGKTTRTGYGG